MENKQKFIGQVMTGKSPARSAEDVDATALSYAEVKALATGDDRIREKMDLDVQVAKLKMLKANHAAMQYEMQDKALKYYPQQMAETRLFIEALGKDLPIVQAHPVKDDAFTMTVMGQVFTERKEAGEAIIKACMLMSDPEKPLDLGEYRGFPMQLHCDGSKFKVTMKRCLTYTAELSDDPVGKEGCSKGTVVGIKTHVVSFCQFLTSQGIAAVADVTPEVIKKFNVQDQHKTPAGKNLYNRHIRLFLIYLGLKQVVPAGLHFALPHCATGGGKIVEVLSQEDRTRIRTYCEKASTPLELRDAAILKIGMTTALRSSDIVALKISDIDWKNRMIRIIQSKTKVEHLHPMETGTGNAIFKYLQNGRSRKADNSYLFIAIRAPYGPLKREACSKSMKRAGTISTDFHRLRRTYATDMLNAGVTFSETAELLGHTDTQNIHKYAALDQDRMRLCPLSMAETGLALEDRYGHE